MSTHQVLVVPVILEPHPNADQLSVVRVGDYTVCARTLDWQGKDRAAYVEPDYCVPKNEQFNFLKAQDLIKTPDGKEGYRIRVVRLRGVLSQGLLVPVESSTPIGSDVINTIGAWKYEQDPETYGVQQGPSPDGIRPCYDTESFYSHNKVFIAGERVIATEKVNGASFRVCFNQDKMFIGSRTEWKKEEDNEWWRALKSSPELEIFCRANPNITVYGEVYGGVRKFRYGRTNLGVVVFDLLKAGRFLNHEEARHIGLNLNWVPVIYDGPFDKELLFSLAEGKTLLGKEAHIREGIVVRPAIERSDMTVGRLCLKIVSNAFLERH